MNQRTLEPSDAEQTALANGIKWVNRTPYIAAGFLLVLIAAYGFAFIKNGWATTPEAWGQLGDYIGGLLNPLVAGFALMAVVVSVRLQKAELAETRRELENSRLAMQEQATTAEQQRREQRFFDFLNIYRSTTDSIQFEMETKAGSVIALQGKRAFRLLTQDKNGNPLRELSHTFQSPDQWNEYFTEPITEEKLIAIWKEGSPVLDHYFRALFTLLREAEPTLKEDCWRYTKLLRAQLSRDEVNLIGINLLYDSQGKKMRDLVAQYGILKHMPTNKLRDKAEAELDAQSFGRKWASSQSTSQPMKATHAD